MKDKSSTSYSEELEENARWQLRSTIHEPRLDEILIRNEFASSDKQQEQSSLVLTALLEHCYDEVPYYREQFDLLNIQRADLGKAGILQRLPILEKGTVGKNAEELRARNLPEGQQLVAKTQTSGTTGQPTIICHSNRSAGTFAWLKQRELRWFRFDPTKSMLSIKPTNDLPTSEEGGWNPDGDLLEQGAWPSVGNIFKTGPAWGYNNTNSVEDQVKILNQQKPDYLVVQASGLEHLAMQEIAADTLSNLKSALSISLTLTPAMRRMIEQSMNIEVEQNYGLNEIGIVASRCREGGCYHVHAEHCMVEIVRPDGSPCDPGEQGRILVTALNNFAMPLLRYDADDLAAFAAEPCRCGRTLPTITDITGRYRRIAHLPAGSFQRWVAIQVALYKVAGKDKTAIKKYQAYQNKIGDFELRIDCDETVLSRISNEVHRVFAEAHSGESRPDLKIIRTNRFLQEGNKFQSFISEFTPEIDI